MAVTGETDPPHMTHTCSGPGLSPQKGGDSDTGHGTAAQMDFDLMLVTQPGQNDKHMTALL